MQHTWKKLLALVLALMLCVSLLPAAYAEGDLGVLEPVEEAEEGEEGQIEPVNGDETEPEPEPEPAEEAIAIPSSGKLPRERHTGPVAPAATGDELLETRSGTCGDNLTWTLDDSGVLTISGTGEMETYGWGDAPWYEYSDQIQSAVIKSGVTLIGSCAFYNCYAMESVSLPASLTDINSNAFSNSGLVSVTIPANVSYIGNYAFDACYSLEKISVSSSNTTFKSVSGALLTKDGTKLVRYPCAKTGSYTIPTGVTVIGNSSFDNCSISKVTIPSSVITVEDYAFYYCDYLSEVIFKGNAPSIEETSFYDVTAEVSYPLNDDTWTEDVFQNYSGSLTWLPGGIHPPVLVTDPQDYACKEGVTASFSVEAEGDSLSYQWYYQKPGSSAWTAVSSASGKKATYSLTTALRHDGYRYKCVVSNPAGSVESASATLTIMVKPTITSQPASVTVMATQKASFAVEATGGALSYKWYYRTSSTASWTAVSAASGKTATYSLTAAKRHNGYQYRCKITNPQGNVTSKTVTLTVTSPTTYRALVIGQNYDNVSSISSLYGDLDLALMEELLGGVDGALGGSFQVTSLFDASASQIQTGIQAAAQTACEDDVFVFYYSGHGVVDSSLGYYAGALCTVEGTSYSTLALPVLAEWLSAVPGKVVVLLDSCGSGAGIYQNGIELSPAERQERAISFNSAVIQAFSQVDVVSKSADVNAGEFCTSKFYVLTAASYDDTSLATSVGSLFTLGLKNAAFGSMPGDTSGDGKTSIHELYVYIEDYVNGRQATQEYPVNSGYNLFAKK